jgi:hypothetical protein
MTESRFQVELSQNWLEDKELVKQAGFKTTGPPDWAWYTSRSSILNKLRDLKPKSGLVITEAALDKYKFLNEQDQKKRELKKLFDKENKAAAQNRVTRNMYVDDNGITCYVVEPSKEKFVMKFVLPAPPDQYCFVCGDPVYNFEQSDLCLWCEEKF